MNLIHALGWTLLHFLWQGALIAVLLASALAFLRHAGSPVPVCRELRRDDADAGLCRGNVPRTQAYRDAGLPLPFSSDEPEPFDRWA